MKADSIIMRLFATAVFMMILYGAGKSMEFQRKCDAACAPRVTITPVIGGVEACFCDEGHGMWRKNDAGID